MRKLTTASSPLVSGFSPGARFSGFLRKLVQEVLHTIHVLNGRGLTILLVEQNVAVSLKISSRAYVLENGRIVMSGPGDKLLHDDRVRQAYLGL